MYSGFVGVIPTVMWTGVSGGEFPVKWRMRIPCGSAVLHDEI